MRDELYRDLVELVTMICRASADSSRTPESPLAQWRLWALGFRAGLHSRRTADRVARVVWQHAVRSEPTPVLAYAAASAAWAVVHAEEGEEMAARLAARAARATMASLARRPARRAVAAASAYAPRSAR